MLALASPPISPPTATLPAAPAAAPALPIFGNAGIIGPMAGHVGAAAPGAAAISMGDRSGGGKAFGSEGSAPRGMIVSAEKRQSLRACFRVSGRYSPVWGRAESGADLPLDPEPPAVGENWPRFSGKPPRG